MELLIVLMIIWLIVNSLTLSDILKKLQYLSRPINVTVLMDKNFNVIKRKIED